MEYHIGWQTHSHKHTENILQQIHFFISKISISFFHNIFNNNNNNSSTSRRKIFDKKLVPWVWAYGCIPGYW